MKNIILKKEYSVTGKKQLINFNSSKTITIDDLNTIFDAMSLEKIKTIPEYFPFMTILNSSYSHKLLSDKNKNDYLIYLKEKIIISQKYNTDYFEKIYPVRNNLLNNIKCLDDCIIPVYKHDSATGRSKIISGTNLMTMKKEKRSLLTYGNNKIFEIDFNSCEPYFYLLSSKMINEDINDVYEKISNDLNIEIKDRKSFKTGIISILYGAQYDTVKKISNINIKNYNNLIDYLNIKSFSEKLSKEIDENNFILNYYNRPVITNNKRTAVNYWVQSSVADFCYLSFNKFISESNINFHGIIHDAIICSSTKKEYDMIQNTKYLKCPISNFKIPVTFS